MSHNPADDSYQSYSLAIATLREINIRKRQILPRADNAQECAWVKAGMVAAAELDTVRENI